MYIYIISLSVQFSLEGWHLPGFSLITDYPDGPSPPCALSCWLEATCALTGHSVTSEQINPAHISDFRHLVNILTSVFVFQGGADVCVVLNARGFAQADASRGAGPWDLGP